MFGANLCAFADEGTSPNAFRMREYGHALCASLVARVLVITMRQGQRRGTNKYRIKSRNGTSGVAEQAVNAHAVLAVFLQLVRSLEILARHVAVFANQPWLHLLQLF